MSYASAPVPAAARSEVWKWWICGLLLLATTINYMDRQTLANVAPRIRAEFELSNYQYGMVELCFGMAFAAGAIVFGILADHTSVRWLYPIVLFAWSLMGFLTSWVEGLAGLMICRTFLGFFEAGHWPCALKTTQRLLPPHKRTLGNSILQSGAAIGAIITPLVMQAMLTSELGSWRFPFQVVGVAGMSWIFFWLASVRERDLSNTSEASGGAGDYRPVGSNGPAAYSQAANFSAVPSKPWNEESRRNPYAPPLADSQSARRPGSTLPAAGMTLGDGLFIRRYLALIALVIGINVPWQIVRAWLPMFLQIGRGYPEDFALYFNSAYNVATDIGCLGAGCATMLLGSLGLSVHRSRSLVFLLCALLTALTLLAALLPAGWLLLAVLLLVAAGSLGLFPCYYSFSQELSVKHQGKISGSLGCFAWIASSLMQPFFGWLGDVRHSYDLGLMLVGCAPLIAFVLFVLLWGKQTAAPR